MECTLGSLFRRHFAGYAQRHRQPLYIHRAAYWLAHCRTRALGGHLNRCPEGHVEHASYNSCHQRYCPQCQGLATERWLAARRAELLPVPYFHVVFTLPHELNALAQGNPRAIYALLFQSVSDTLIEFGANPCWLGGAIAATLVLHTWGQTLSQHLHLHALIAAGALAPNGHWITSRRGFLFPVKALSPLFCGKFMAGLKQLFSAGTLKFAASSAPLADASAQRRLRNTLYEKPWVVYAKRSFAGPAQVLDYLGRYTHRVAISNHRLLSCSNTAVRFRYKDYAHGNRRKVLSLEPAEFIRRFLLHVLPSGFMRIRHYGILANRAKGEKLAQARAALDHPNPTEPRPSETVEAFWLRVANLDIHRCPHCKTGRMVVIGPINVPQARAPPLPPSP